MIRNTLFILISILSGLQTKASERREFIVGGTEVTRQDPIASVTVALTLHDPEGESICTGLILDSNRILTAAHCVEGFSQGKVVFKTTDAYQNDLSNSRVITRTRILPGYKGGKDLESRRGIGEITDLALVFFSGGLPRGYHPAQFLPESIIKQVIIPKMPVTLAGYGVTASGWSGEGRLRKVNTEIQYFTFHKINFHAGTANHQACQGDSGGPAFIYRNSQWYVVGILSRSNCESRSIYTPISTDKIYQFSTQINLF